MLRHENTGLAIDVPREHINSLKSTLNMENIMLLTKNVMMRKTCLIAGLLIYSHSDGLFLLGKSSISTTYATGQGVGIGSKNAKKIILLKDDSTWKAGKFDCNAFGGINGLLRLDSGTYSTSNDSIRLTTILCKNEANSCQFIEYAYAIDSSKIRGAKELPIKENKKAIDLLERYGKPKK